MGLRSTQRGEIVQVQGGHIIRATGRKDRHSKVFTAKGPRDRRVRLAAHTAIQFYDVQDRLGYDRPSKAVDWLINKAKASIDKLAELPPWDPTTYHSQNNSVDENNHNVGGSNQMSLGAESGENSLGTSQFYVPQCVDTVSQSLGDSMRSFFPTNASQENNSFQNYPHQDLCLSLHSTVHDPGSGVQSAHQSHPGHDQSLFHGGFDGGWAQHQDVGRFTRLMGWVGDSGGIGGGGGEGRGGLMFANSPSLMSTQALLLNQPGSSTMANFCHNNQRGTLQSSYSHLPRVFEDSQSHNLSSNHHHQSINSIGHGSDSFMGLYIPSQMNGDLHGGASMSNRASSSSLSPDDSTQH